jgi:hypothetical protein
MDYKLVKIILACFAIIYLPWNSIQAAYATNSGPAIKIKALSLISCPKCEDLIAVLFQNHHGADLRPQRITLGPSSSGTIVVGAWIANIGDVGIPSASTVGVCAQVIANTTAPNGTLVIGYTNIPAGGNLDDQNSWVCNNMTNGFGAGAPDVPVAIVDFPLDRTNDTDVLVRVKVNPPIPGKFLGIIFETNYDNNSLERTCRLYGSTQSHNGPSLFGGPAPPRC